MQIKNMMLLGTWGSEKRAADIATYSAPVLPGGDNDFGHHNKLLITQPVRELHKLKRISWLSFSVFCFFDRFF